MEESEFKRPPSVAAIAIVVRTSCARLSPFVQTVIIGCRKTLRVTGIDPASSIPQQLGRNGSLPTATPWSVTDSTEEDLRWKCGSWYLTPRAPARSRSD
jgi:hypothetical protein